MYSGLTRDLYCGIYYFPRGTYSSHYLPISIHYLVYTKQIYYQGDLFCFFVKKREIEYIPRNIYTTICTGRVHSSSIFICQVICTRVCTVYILLYISHRDHIPDCIWYHIRRSISSHILLVPRDMLDPCIRYWSTWSAR
jgi:hypothetical protein